MRYADLSESFLRQIILEAEGKNTHLEHLEDNIFNKGFQGAKDAVNYLYSLHEMLEGNTKTPISMTTKWDGAPAVVAGKDPETGKFFVGTKGVFAQKPKINFTDKDIEENHPSEGLQEKLKTALRNLRKLNWNTVAQGDMLYSKSDLETKTINGEEVLIFKPNTIVYAVPTDSDLAKQISSSDMGIVWHTEYVGGPTLADTQAKFGFNSSELGSTPSVWHRDAIIKDFSGTVTFTQEESDNVMSAISEADNYLKSIDSETFGWLEKGNDLIGKDFLQQLKAHVNNNIRAGAFDEPTKFAQGFVQKYIDFMQKKIDGYKTEKKQEEMTEKLVQGVKFIKEHVPGIVAVYDLYLKLIEAKIRIVKKLETIRQLPTFKETDNGYEVTGEEGFVAVDRMGNALKLVDRLEFSRLNFGTGIPGK
jgi:RNAse (barnase) inhibitor barstar